MHDIRLIRLNPEEFDKKMDLRKLSGVSTKILELDKARRIKIKAAEEALAERNNASKKIGKAKADNDQAEFAKLKALVSKKKNEISKLEDEAKKDDKILNDFLMQLPNSPLDDVPIGENEDDNVEIRRWGEIPSFDFSPKEHFELAATVQDMDFEVARNLSGSRFVVLKGSIARIHRALAQFMIDTHIEKHGLMEMNTPVLVRDQAMIGTGQLPKFADDSYRTTDGKWL
ncbi:MAG: serine--tRNA ligase, partial [Paracoccaceae bacterium]|nr:serine--tRNA ligase [Paracoccaceae bacterium]